MVLERIFVIFKRIRIINCCRCCGILFKFVFFSIKVFIFLVVRALVIKIFRLSFFYLLVYLVKRVIRFKVRFFLGSSVFLFFILNNFVGLF